MDRPSSHRCGVSLPELLVVISILALGVMISIPLIADRVHDAKLRAAASRYAMTLRAARMVAVAEQMPVTVTVRPDPDNVYEYLDSGGRLRTTELPGGAWIDEVESTPSFTFGPDGSLDATAKTVLRSKMSAGTVESWTVDIPLTGIPRVRRDPD